ncbi:50S ribosomal protein L11 methyltransferase [Saccharothrix sp.]|uniref:50S ribosomal protein L11 methyltransferase n=1 Tax=Saccharothrix sp. TaxID=1873460 RepID=UPI00281159D9|nr:50S ribosomal protein L11 methyltransferase [Saccharothrix sp.]
MDITEIEHWNVVGRKLAVSEGVHRPSTFSALLAATLTDCRNLVVVDAGCGAGLATVAALAAGARHVIAQDYDPAALADTARNVTDVLGPEARRRLTLWEADWTMLTPMKADLLAVNPPQRPSSLLPDVPEDQRHLHSGGGPDGLDGIRTVLSHAGAHRVRTTANAILNLTEASTPGWSAPRKVAGADLPLDPSWRSVVPDLRGRVDVWEFHRSDTHPQS